MDRTQAVRVAARKLDELEQKRERLTVQIDAEIDEARRQLESLINPRRSGKPPRKRPSPIADAIVAMLQEDGATDYGKLATGAYGDDTPDTRHKVRAQLFNLSRGGRIRRDGDSGPWQVVLTNGAAGAGMHS